MKVQVWSDFVCPFCYIGQRHLEAAIQEVDPSIEVEFMSYELDPNHVDQVGVSMAQMLANKYGMSLQEAEMNNQRVLGMAKQAGLNYDFDIMKHSNTFKAHKLFQYAKEIGKGNELSEILLDAYFTQGAYLNDEAQLIELAGKAGIEAAKAKEILASDEYGLKVRQDEQWAQSINVKGVPHFVIDDQVSLSGAQPVETFKQALLHVKTLNFNSSSSDMMCEDGVCAIKEP